MRRLKALGLLLGASVMLLTFSFGGWLLLTVRDQEGALVPWWIRLAGSVVIGLYLIGFSLSFIVAVRALLGVPRAVIDARGITLAGTGLIEWSDVREVELVRRRFRTLVLRIALDSWEKYAARRPGWVRLLGGGRPEPQAVALYLEATDADPSKLCALIRDAAARHRRPAA